MASLHDGFRRLSEPRPRSSTASIHTRLERVDTGRVVAQTRASISDAPSFLDLMCEKKQRGGAMLATLVRECVTRDGLPDSPSADTMFTDDPPTTSSRYYK